MTEPEFNEYNSVYKLKTASHFRIRRVERLDVKWIISVLFWLLDLKKLPNQPMVWKNRLLWKNPCPECDGLHLSMSGAFWLSTHINLSLYLTLYRVAFLRNDTLALDQNSHQHLETFLESQAALSVPTYLSSLFLFPATRRGELMIHLLLVTFWITELWCTSATLSSLSLLFLLP